MRILQIISLNHPSGAARHVLILSARLQASGHDVSILTPPGGWLSEAARAAGIPVREVVMRGAPGLRELVSIVRARRFDIVHGHMTRAAYGAFVIGRLARVPVAATFHNLTRDPLYRRILPRGRNRLVAVSGFVRDHLLSLGVPSKFVRTIYNGTDLADADPGQWPESRSEVLAALEIDPGCLVVGIFGQVGEEKGHQLLASAVPAIVAACPRARFLVVGRCSGEWQNRVRGLAGEAEDRLHFTGERLDVPDLLRAVDVVTVPSPMETFGMIAAEAMALGTPVVASRAGGLPEVVADNETGILIQRTPPALSAALSRLLLDEPLRASMAIAAQARARALFSANRMASETETLYREMLAEPHA